MIFWNISKSFQKKNLRGGCQQAVRTTVWNYNRQDKVTDSAYIEQFGIILWNQSVILFEEEQAV